MLALAPNTTTVANIDSLSSPLVVQGTPDRHSQELALFTLSGLLFRF